MKINSINKKRSFGARISKELKAKLAKDREFLYSNPSFAHEDEDLYMMNYVQIRRMFPDGELCLDKNDKTNLILKHDGKKDIVLGKLPEICSMSDIAEKLYKTIDNIAAYLK